MKEKILSTPIIIKHEDELSDMEKQMRDEALRATYRSYSPYSGFSVGAALLLADGTIVTGSNQENAAYPSGLCAERTAMFYANSTFPDTPIICLCITARSTDGQTVAHPISPCGACRQSLLEAETRQETDIKVMLYATDQTFILKSIKALLPLSFGQSDLFSK